jgi:SAM-dependent methyltransferase
MLKVRIEDGLVVGTSGNKYGSSNPISKYLIRCFDKSVLDLVGSVSPTEILEIGCGEGHVTELLLMNTLARIHATEISPTILEQTKRTLSSDRISWEVAKLESYQPSFTPDLVVCCEVLEHLTDPLDGLHALKRIEAPWYLLSVPREPLWRMLNMSRGAYLKDFGNSPGHLQHWSRRGFVQFVSHLFEVVNVVSPTPWTVLLCRPR